MVCKMTISRKNLGKYALGIHFPECFNKYMH